MRRPFIRLALCASAAPKGLIRKARWAMTGRVSKAALAPSQPMQAAWITRPAKTDRTDQKPQPTPDKPTSVPKPRPVKIRKQNSRSTQEAEASRQAKPALSVLAGRVIDAAPTPTSPERPPPPPPHSTMPPRSGYPHTSRRQPPTPAPNPAGNPASAVSARAHSASGGR